MTAGARTVFTGAGVLSSLGKDLPTFWANLISGAGREPQVSDLPSLGRLPLKHAYGIAVQDRQHIADSVGKPLGRLGASDYALYATRQAVEQSGLVIDGGRIGVVIGSGMGDGEVWADTDLTSATRADPIFRTSEGVASELGAAGPVIEVSTACSAGAYAIAMAELLIRHGDADAVICGGAEMLSFHALAAFNRLGALDPEACRPFDERRRGTVTGEGAAVFVLESEGSAKKRGAECLAVLSGVGMSCDATHMTAPAPDGKQIERALRDAISHAGLGPEDIDALIPHATGTGLNDSLEAEIFRRVFGEGDLPFSVLLKELVGHGAGASGALSVLAAILTVKFNTVPPSGRRMQLDPSLSIRVASEPVLGASLKHVAVTAYAFGGNNIALAVSRPGTVATEVHR